MKTVRHIIISIIILSTLFLSSCIFTNEPTKENGKIHLYVTIENNICLAPMAGVSDLPFRVICKKFGPGLTCTEMVSSKALFYNDEKTKYLLNKKCFEKIIFIKWGYWCIC